MCRWCKRRATALRRWRRNPDGAAECRKFEMTQQLVVLVPAETQMIFTAATKNIPPVACYKLFATECNNTMQRVDTADVRHSCSVQVCPPTKCCATQSLNSAPPSPNHTPPALASSKNFDDHSSRAGSFCLVAALAAALSGAQLLCQLRRRLLNEWLIPRVRQNGLESQLHPGCHTVHRLGSDLKDRLWAVKLHDTRPGIVSGKQEYAVLHTVHDCSNKGGRGLAYLRTKDVPAFARRQAPRPLGRASGRTQTAQSACGSQPAPAWPCRKGNGKG